MFKKLKYNLTYFFFLSLLLLTGCNKAFVSENEVSHEKHIVVENEAGDISANSNVLSPMPFEEYDIQLMAIGDNLIHMGVVNTGYQEDGSLNFNFLFDNISEFLHEAEISIINQETPLAGNELGFSGYPLFNSPTEIGDAIADCGFNVVLQASNHSADQGISGIDNCISFWKTHPEVLLAGIHEPENKSIPILTIEDFSFAILNYTYGPNYESVSESLSERLNILCSVDEETNIIDFTTISPQVLEDIKYAKTVADIVIVCPHWGNEYQTTPSKYQEEFALQMTQAGADVIIGTHPHVVQPVRIIEASNGNKALCYYSLGNYVSTQKNGQSMLEAMAWVNFHVTKNGISLSIDNSGVIPLICHYTSNPVRIQNIYLLEEYTAELASQHGIISYGGISFSLEDLIQWSEDILGEWIISADEILR